MDGWYAGSFIIKLIKLFYYQKGKGEEYSFVFYMEDLMMK